MVGQLRKKEPTEHRPCTLLKLRLGQKLGDLREVQEVRHCYKGQMERSELVIVTGAIHIHQRGSSGRQKITSSNLLRLRRHSRSWKHAGARFHSRHWDDENQFLERGES